MNSNQIQEINVDKIDKRSENNQEDENKDQVETLQLIDNLKQNE